MDHEDYMRRAIALAKQGMESNAGGPFGAVIVRDGHIVGEGFNRVTSTPDPTAHAEVMAIQNAARNINNHWLRDCVLYASCEPCPMCHSASLWARIQKIFYAATAVDAANVGFDDVALYEALGMNPQGNILVLQQILRDEALAVMSGWHTKKDRILY